MSALSDLITLLKAGTCGALVGQRMIMVGLVEESWPVPYVQVRQIGSDPENYLSGITCFEYNIITVRAYADDAAEAWSIISAAKTDSQGIATFGDTQTGEDPDTKRDFVQVILNIGSQN